MKKTRLEWSVEHNFLISTKLKYSKSIVTNINFNFKVPFFPHKLNINSAHLTSENLNLDHCIYYCSYAMSLQQNTDSFLKQNERKY